MNLLCDDNSYRSDLAAINFTSLMQTRLASDARHQWVERAELDKAENELSLSGFQLIDRSEAIRSGRWAKADWGVFGRISSSSNSVRSLSLEIVDLQRADLLAATNLALLPQSVPSFQVSSTDVSNALTVLNSLLRQADEIARLDNESTRMALLFLSPSSIDEPAFQGIEDDFQRAVEENSISGSIRTLRFRRAGEAMDEANFILSGLVQADPNAWQKVADNYVWGHYTVNNSQTFVPQSRTWTNGSVVNIILNVWNGRSEPQIVALRRTNSEPATLARELAGLAAKLIVRGSNSLAGEGLRKRISDSLVTNALTALQSVRTPFAGTVVYLDNADGRRHWLDLIQELETACFFDPGNISARELWARIRWGHITAAATQNEFFFDRRRSAVWGSYVDQFGFRSVLPPPPHNWWKPQSIAAEYLLSAWRPFEMFEYAAENRAQWGMPMDIGGTDLTAWQNEFGSEFIARLLKTPSEPEFVPLTEEFLSQSLTVENAQLRSQAVGKLAPVLCDMVRTGRVQQIDSQTRVRLRSHFQDIGKPAEYEKLMVDLSPPSPAASAPANTPVHLPRASEAASTVSGDIFKLPPLDVAIPLTDCDGQRIAFPAGVRPEGIRQMVYHRGTLWLAVDVSEPQQISATSDHLQSELQPVMASHVRLWKMDVQHRTLEPVAGPLSTNDINCLAVHGDTLWLALNDAGIAALNPESGELHRFQFSAGLKSTNQFAITETAKGVVAIGGMSDLNYLPDGTDTWRALTPPPQTFSYGGEIRRIAGMADSLLLFNSRLLLCHPDAGTWATVSDKPAMDGLGHVISITGSHHDSFWMVTSSGLNSINASGEIVGSLWVPMSPTINNTPPAGLPAELRSRFLRSAQAQSKAIREKLILRRHVLDAAHGGGHTPNPFVPHSRITGAIWGVTPDDANEEGLWVASGSSVLLYHPDSREFAGGFSIYGFGGATALVSGDRRMWIAFHRGADVYVQGFDTAPIISRPRAQWVPSDVSEQELDRYLASLNADERRTYDFFAGDDLAVIQSVDANQDDLDAQSLFIAAVATRETGRTNEAERFVAKLKDQFPDGPFTQVLDREQKLDEIRDHVREKSQSLSAQTVGQNQQNPVRSPRPTVDQIMATYDTDHDGGLNELELTVLCEAQPNVISPVAAGAGGDPSELAARIFQRYNVSHDGILKTNELAFAMTGRPQLPGRLGRAPRTPLPFSQPPTNHLQ